MADNESLVESEINSHHTDLSMWIESVTSLNIPTSHHGVRDRFIMDCKTLSSYMNAKENPTAADLVDFGDRHASLEIQYNHIFSNNS